MDRNKKIFLIDIDNTIANYSKGLTEFSNRVLRRNSNWKNGIYESERLNLNIQDPLYESLKEVYRLSGEKLYLEPIEGAKDFIDMVKQHYKILIWTERPTHEYPIIKEYTKEWLNKHGFYYDDIIWNRGFNMLKELEIWKDEKEKIGETMSEYEIYAIDDQRNKSNTLSNSGIIKEVFLLDWLYNVGEVNGNVHRFKDYLDLWKYFINKIDYEK